MSLTTSSPGQRPTRTRTPAPSLLVAALAVFGVASCERAESAVEPAPAGDVAAPADLGPSPEPPECVSASDCPAPAPCAVAACSADGRCVAAHAPSGTPCVPDDACAASGACNDGVCEAAGNLCPCEGPACADGAAPEDTDGDGCADACVPTCASACDCYHTPPPACSGCSECAASWRCVIGADGLGRCRESCGPVPESTLACAPCTDDGDCPSGTRCVAGCGASVEARCRPVPTQCPPETSPVCGCDGLTYAGPCAAARAVVAVASEGPCACSPQCAAAPSTADPACAASPPPAGCPGLAFCEAEGCGAPTTCTAVPTVCPLGGAPVCGCDGAVYTNDCARRAARVGVAPPETCGCPALSCPAGSAPAALDGSGCADACVACPPLQCTAGAKPIDLDGNGCADACAETYCVAGEACPAGSFCARPGCGGAGVCKPVPTSCTPTLDDAVCGCDGATYASACDAASAGDSVSHPGPCGLTCVAGGAPCPAGSTCDPHGAACDTLSGTCQPLDGCAAEPECGCDGVTYASACARRAAGVARLHGGACACPDLACEPGAVPESGAGCPDECVAKECTTHADCGPAAWCERLECGAAAGTCRPVPTACDGTGDPICGCDGATWADACAAAAAGVSVAFPGPCTPSCSATGECLPGTACDRCDGGGACRSITEPCEEGMVCGCDGRSWPSDCARAEAGVGLASLGPCACTHTADCAPDQYCQLAGCGAAVGVCLTRPLTCPPGSAAVCDCDGVQHASACHAQAAGATPAPCPGTCVGGEAGCPAGQYCDACAGASGVCAPFPAGCGPSLGAPACGCDGTLYASECLRRQSGVASAPLAKCCQPVDCPGPLVPVDSAGGGCPDTCGPCVAPSCKAGHTPVDTGADGCPDTCVAACPALPACTGAATAYDSDGDGCLDACCAVPECDVKPLDADADGCAETCPCAGPVCKAPLVEVDATGDGCADGCACPVAPECPGTQFAFDKDGDGCVETCACPPAPECKPPRTPQDLNGDVCADACLCPKLACSAPKKLTDTNTDGCPDSCACPPLVCTGSRLAKDSNGDGCADLCVCPGKPTCTTEQSYADANLDGCADACVCKAPVCAAGTTAVDNDGSGCAESCAPCANPVSCATGTVAFDKDDDGCKDVCVQCSTLTCAGGKTPFDLNRDGCPETCAPTTCLSSADCAHEQLSCARTNGSCAGKGVCVARPAGCAVAHGVPVCGCDEQTYATACAAAAKGADVRRVGVCCPALSCSSGASPQDRDGDGCAETCVCLDGSLESVTACTCGISCPPSTFATDGDSDGCPESCSCVNPGGCAPVCESSIACGGLPSTSRLVDLDADGCYDVLASCPEGLAGTDVLGDGCSNACLP